MILHASLTVLESSRMSVTTNHNIGQTRIVENVEASCRLRGWLPGIHLLLQLPLQLAELSTLPMTDDSDDPPLHMHNITNI